MISYMLLLTGLSLIDGILASLFPFDPSYMTMSFVPSVAFISLAFLSRKLPLKQTIILAFLLGAYQDLLVNRVLFLYVVIYVGVMLIAQLWSKSISNSMFESILFVITTLFVKEIALYLIMTIANSSRLSVFQWFLKREFLTLLLHSMCSVLVLKFIDLLQGYLQTQEEERRKGENVRWLQLRLKEEKKNYK